MGQGNYLELVKKSKLRVVGRKSNPERLRKFLDEITKIPVLTEACRKAGFTTHSVKVYLAQSADGEARFIIKWRDIEGPFHEHFSVAFTEGQQRVEAVAYTRATGYQKVLVDRGRVQYKLDPEKLDLGLTGIDAYLLDDTGKPIPETVWEQSEDLIKFILERTNDRYKLRQEVDVNETRTVIVVGARAKNSAEIEKQEQDAQNAPPLDVEFREVEPD